MISCLLDELQFVDLLEFITRKRLLVQVSKILSRDLKRRLDLASEWFGLESTAGSHEFVDLR